MRAPRTCLSLGLLGFGCLLHAAAARADGVPAPDALRAQLLASAQAWSDKGQTEFARQKLAKLLAIEPDSPEGLAFMGDLALRENKLDEAHKVLERMQTWQPGHPATRELEHAYQIYSQQREKLTRMRLMARAGRNQDAAALARELFPDGAPHYGSLGQEIARITGQPSRAATLKPPVAPVAVAKAPTRPTLPRSASVAPAPTRRIAPDGQQQLAGKAVTRAGKPEVSSTASKSLAPIAAPALVVAAAAPATDQATQATQATQASQSERLRAQAEMELQAQRLSPALRLLEESLQLQPDDAWLRFDLARLYIRLQQPQTARSVADEGLTRMPADTDMRYAHALLMESLDADDVAMADLANIPTNQLSDGMRALASRVSARQTAQAQAQSQAQTPATGDSVSNAATPPRQAWVEVGQIGLEKNSTEGLGSLRGWERPAVAWLPWGAEGTLFAHADAVQLDAGTYAGGDPFAQPGTEQITSGVPQQASGANIGVGYLGPDWRWDLGETGVGFAVRNWVGGVRHSGALGNVDYNLELARRPMTGTLLSYAGTQDPRSGAVWGGVVATSAGGRVATEFGPINASVSASVASLTGQNVADNSRVQWRMAADSDIYKSAHQVVNMGLALSGRYHEKDLSGYTWGQGGYYSPTRNLSLALPVEWSGREGRFTWLLKASVSVSDSFSGASDYYPGNAAMQAQDNRVYTAGGSNGTGWAVSGAAEYQVSPNLALGARLEHEVSDYYAPLTMLFYARYLFDPVSQPLAQRPRPVQAYSQF